MFGKILQNLQNFYNSQASQFVNSRKKTWPEFKYILEIIDKYPESDIKILELGCGGGRLYEYLASNSTKNITYQGVDIAQQLIQLAVSNSQAKFIVAEMIDYLKQVPQNDFDFVICVASFQHLPTLKLRLQALKYIYRSLKYQGQLIMINWSFSARFIKKYFLQIIKAISKFIGSLGFLSYQDLLIPWKTNNKTFYRYYHIFLLSELKKIFKLSGFIINELTYINNQGVKSNKLLVARNSWIVGEKNVIEE